MNERYGIAEWFGEPFHEMAAHRRRELARMALKMDEPPPCPFQTGKPSCNKRGGVCSIRKPEGLSVITCPYRFQEKNLLPLWLAEIAGFPDPYVAHEVPFMRDPRSGKAAGRMDLVISNDGNATRWYGLELQAVYFSGRGMDVEFEALLVHADDTPPEPLEIRRPDWRSSSAKRLMPQIQTKTPVLRRWGSKMVVSLDFPFFEALGGPSENSTTDLNDGDVIWLIPRVNETYELERYHWEVLTLDASCDKLLAAVQVKREDFEKVLKSKLGAINSLNGN